MLKPIKAADVPPLRETKYPDIRKEISDFVDSDKEAAEVVYDADKYGTVDTWRSVYRTVASQFRGIKAVQRKERLFIVKI